MNIVLTLNDAYSKPVITMLTSLFMNNNLERHCIYLLYSVSNLQSSNIARIRQVVEKFGNELRLSPVDEALFRGFKVDHHFSVEAYYRFLVQSILPDEASRAIYLEADQIIKGDLSDFYYSDLGGKCVAVCQSINKNPGPLLSKLQLPPQTVYFNSGVILYDLARLRQTVPQSAYFDYLHEHQDCVTWMDQDVLNVIYADKKCIADYRQYNYMIFDNTQLTEAEQNEIETHTKIIHYIGAVKPWMPGYRGHVGEYWRYYERMTYTPVERLISNLKNNLRKLKHHCINRLI